MAKKTPKAKATAVIGKGLLPDVPVENLEKSYSRSDGLERNALVEILADSAIYTPDTLTVGIYGDWGCGKTSMMHLMERHVSNSNVAVPVWFNAWQFEREDHLIIPLIATVNKALEEYCNSNKKGISDVIKKGAQEIANALRSVAYAFSWSGEVGIPGFASSEVSFSGKDAIERSDKLRDSYAELAEETVLERSLYFDAFKILREASSGLENAPKIVVFVDDLDRCFPKAAVSLLENIKLVLDLPNFSFVLGLAPEIVEKFVWKTHYKDLGFEEEGKDGKKHLQKYLDKFVQVPIRVPEPEHKQLEILIQQLITENKKRFSAEESKELDLLAPIAALIGDGNPRDVVRFLNEVIVLYRVSVTDIKYSKKGPLSMVDLAFANRLRKCRAALLRDKKIVFPTLDKIGKKGTVLKISELIESQHDQTKKIDPFWFDFPDPLPFRIGLTKILEGLQDEENPDEPFDEDLLRALLKELEACQYDATVKDALRFIGDEMALCRALCYGDASNREVKVSENASVKFHGIGHGLAWLRDLDGMRRSFQLSSVFAQSDTVDKEIDAALDDWDQIENLVTQEEVDPLGFDKIKERLYDGEAIPDFAQPYVKSLKPLDTKKIGDHLDLEGCISVTDIGVLSSCVNLESLCLDRCVGVTDIDVLSSCENLSELRLVGCVGVTDIDGLSSCVNLHYLWLEGCIGIADISVLSSCENLDCLDLEGCVGVTDVGVLSTCENLTNLWLSGCTGVTDISGLSSCVKLTNLGLSGCTGVTDIGVLSSCENLTKLWLSGSGVTDIGVLSSCVNLDNLSLMGCVDVTDIGVLSSCENLTKLWLSGCTGVTDISGLSSCENLTKLWLSGCGVKPESVPESLREICIWE